MNGISESCETSGLNVQDTLCSPAPSLGSRPETRMVPSTENFKTRRKGMSADPGVGQPKHGGVATVAQLLSELEPH